MKESTKRCFGINRTRFRHWVWWVFPIVLTILGIFLLLQHPLYDKMVWFALLFFTGIYAYSTDKLATEAKEQRLDSSRPLLVPIGGREGIARLAEMPKLDNEQGWLHVHNIGVGPAVNIAVRLGIPTRPSGGTEFGLFQSIAWWILSLHLLSKT